MGGYPLEGGCRRDQAGVRRVRALATDRLLRPFQLLDRQIALAEANAPRTGPAHGELVRLQRLLAAASSSGPKGTTISMASSTAMMNATTHQWDELAIEASGVDPEQLPAIWNEREPLDGLGSDVCLAVAGTGIVPWFRGIGDGACANVGSGGLGPNRIALTVGTSGALRMVRPLPAGASPDMPESLWTYRLDDRGP